MDISQRLNTIIENDKRINTDKITSVIKSDFFYLISSYFEVKFDSLKVDINSTTNGYSISVSCFGEKIKFVRSIPE